MEIDFNTLQELMQNCGIIGAGGAGFPTHAKLNMKASTILLNCAECEPLLTLHRQLLSEKTLEIMSALDTISKTLGVSETIICVKKEYEETVSAVETYLNEFENINLKLLDSVYPTGDEVVLIYETLKKRVPAGKIPIDVGVIVFNVETMYNAYLALTKGKAVTDKLVTITGAVNNPVTVKVAIGTKLNELLNLANGATIEDFSYLVGGPMMGFLGNGNTTVTKTTNAVLILPKEHKLIKSKEVNPAIGINRASSACCQCMACTDLCPRSNLGYPIKPHLFMRAIANNDYNNIDVLLDTFFCCGCGICEKFACPQSLAPATLISTFKNNLRSQGVKMPQDRELKDVTHHREYRCVPENRLEMSIDLSRYHSKASLNDKLYKPKKAYIQINQHIGSPLFVKVNVGDTVKIGDVIATQESGLYSVLHASIDGKIESITKNQVVIYGGDILV